MTDLHTGRPRGRLFAFALGLCAATALSACHKNPDASAANAPDATPASPPADAAVAPAVAAPAAIDYGILGAPADDVGTNIDPKFNSLTPEQLIARFRHNEKHPLQGDETHIITWDAIDESVDYQRALFYAVVRVKPALATDGDWKAVREDEKDLVESSCNNAGATGVRYTLSADTCARAGFPQAPASQAAQQ